MAIYRGTGGAGDATNDVTINGVTEKALQASNSAAAAANSATDAASSASTATTQASNASTSAASAANSATDAASSATSASSSAATATTKASEAATSATNAATSETNAAASATSASSSATSAATSATNAATSAATATTKASEALTSASNAATSESNASGSETAAANSATSSANSATASAGSATSAAASAASAAVLLDNFDDRYLGAKTTEPTVDNDGDPLIIGALYFNSTSGSMNTYTATGWIEASSASVETMNKYKYTATASQTVFSGTDDGGNTLALTVGVEIVTLNGVVLEEVTDYTRTTSSVTLTSGADAGDELNVFAFGNFTVADTVSKSAGGTFQDNVTVDGDFVVNNNVGIGTSSPARRLHVEYTDSNNIPAILKSAVNSCQIAFSDGDSTQGQFSTRIGSLGDSLAFYTNGPNERMRIDSAGRVTTPNQPAFLAYYSVGNFLMTGDLTPNNAPLNTGNYYNTSNGRFTAPVSGTYLISVSGLGWTGGGRVGFKVNGSIPIANIMQFAGATERAATTTLPMYLNAGDYVSSYTEGSTYSAYFYFAGYLIG